MDHKNNIKIISMSRLLLGLAALITLVTGCAAKTVVPKNPAAEEAAIKMEEAKREYDECYDAPGRPSCNALKRLYERDRKAYEDSLK